MVISSLVAASGDVMRAISGEVAVGKSTGGSAAGYMWMFVSRNHFRML